MLSVCILYLSFCLGAAGKRPISFAPVQRVCSLLVVAACHPPSATELCNRDRRCDRQFAYIALERRRGEKATNSLAACTYSGSLARSDFINC